MKKLLLASCLSLTIVTCFIFVGCGEKDSIYDEAVALLNDGNYSEAIEAFESIDGFKDSNDLLAKAVDEQYAIAEDYLSNRNYKESFEAFKVIQNYKDSSERLKKFVIMPSQYDPSSEDGMRFEYDEKGRLTEIHELGTGDNDPACDYKITYSDNDKILKMVETGEGTDVNGDKFKEKEVYDYSDDGMIKLDFETTFWGDENFKGEYKLDEFGFPLELSCKHLSENDGDYHEYHGDWFVVKYDDEGKIDSYGFDPEQYDENFSTDPVVVKYDEFGNFTGFDVTSSVHNGTQVDYETEIVGYNENKIEFEREQIIAILLAEKYTLHLDLYLK